MRADSEEREIKERWPDKCPECGCAAWLGLNQYACVNRDCRHGSQREHDAYHELLADDNKLSLPDLDEMRRQLDTVMPIFSWSPRDWHYCLENDQPIKDNGQGEWWYQLPHGEAQKVNLHDLHVSSVNGITYEVCSVDPFTDVISIRWAKNQPTP